jgi:hypothetical protein
MKNNFPFIMKAVAVVTVLLTAVLTVAYHLYHQNWMLTAAISTGTTAYHFVMRLVVGYIVPKLTNYDFDYRHWWFRPWAWEPAFYKKLNIKNWKGQLPTYAPDQFSMKDNSLHRIIQNMCGAEIVHEVIMVLSFLPIPAASVFGDLPEFLITSVLAALYDSIFVMAQRFNRPRLIKIYEKQEAKALE